MSRMQKLIEFTIQGKALSVNEAYVNGRGNQRAKSAAYNEFEHNVCEQLVDNSIPTELCILKMEPLFVFYRFYFPIYKKGTKKISKRAGDVSNFIKPLEDIMGYYFGFDDSQIVGFFPRKMQSEQCYFQVEIFRVENIDESPLEYTYGKTTPRENFRVRE